MLDFEFNITGLLRATLVVPLMFAGNMAFVNFNYFFYNFLFHKDKNNLTRKILIGFEASQRKA